MRGVTTVYSWMGKKRYLMIYLMAWLCLPVSGQISESQHSANMHIQLTETRVEALNRDLVGVVLMLENKGETDVISRIETKLPPGFAWLSPGPQDTIEVSAGSKRFISLRFRVTATATSGQEQLQINLYKIADSPSPLLLAQTELHVHISDNRALQMHSLDPLKRMRYLNDSISIPVLLRNTGNTDEQIQLVTSLPTTMGARRFQTMDLSVRAGTDTIVHVGFIADKTLFEMDQFQFRIAGLYADQAVFNHLIVIVQNASSARTFPREPEQGYHWGQRQNQLTLSSRNPLSDYQSMFLDANLALNRSGSQVELNTQMYQWGKLNQTPILTNTWLSYSRQGMNLTIGNLMESAEKYIHGRGARFAYLDSAADFRFIAGAADKSHDLLNYYGRGNPGVGYSMFTKYQSGGFQPDSRQKYAGTILYDRDPFDNSESIVHAATIPLIHTDQSSRTQLSVQFGAGLSRALTDTTGSHRTEPSMALGANFTKDFGRFYINSHNYYSTAYYPGMQRGSLQLSQRIGMRSQGGNYWLSYDAFQFDPGSFMDHMPEYFLSTELIELGTSWALSPFSSLSLIPNRYQEENLLLYDIEGVNEPKIRMSSWRVKSMWNWRSRNNRHYAHLSLEGARPSSSYSSVDQSWAYRSTLSYNFWKLSLNMNYQNGYFSVYDVISNLHQEHEEIYRMGGSLHFNHQSHPRFRTNISLQYYQDSFFGINESANARVDWSIHPRTALFGSAQIYQYRHKQYGARQHTNVQVGVSQSLAGISSHRTVKNGTLQVFAFYDHNRNAVFDEGDEIAKGKTILVDNSMFLTDAEGTVRYHKLPYGHYRIQVPVEKGWHASTQAYLLDQRNGTLSIPLLRSGTITGGLVFDFDPRLSMSANTNLEGYTITAFSQNGTVTQSRTNARGEFMLFLPEGLFTISIHDHEFPEHVYTESTKLDVQVEAGKINELPHIVLKVRERIIDVKRFGTPLEN